MVAASFSYHEYSCKFFKSIKAIATGFIMIITKPSLALRFGKVSLMILVLLPFIAFPKQDDNVQKIVKDLQVLNEQIKNSEIIVDAQVISKESRFTYNEDGTGKGIYTLTKFKVLHKINGEINGDEFTIDQSGGKVGDTVEVHSGGSDPSYRLNDRAIYFFSNKTLNTNFIEVGRYFVENGKVEIGFQTLYVDQFINLIKQLKKNEKVLKKYIDEVKKYGILIDSVQIGLKFPPNVKPPQSPEIVNGMLRVNGINSISTLLKQNDDIQEIADDLQKLYIQINNSEIIIDAQVVAMESKWIYNENGTKRGFYTLVKFKVFHEIKGEINSDEFKLCQSGANLGDTIFISFSNQSFRLNDRAIYFFRNKTLNPYLLEEGIHPVEDGKVWIGSQKVHVDRYIDIIKQLKTDGKVMQKYIDEVKKYGGLIDTEEVETTILPNTTPK